MSKEGAVNEEVTAGVSGVQQVRRGGGGAGEGTSGSSGKLWEEESGDRCERKEKGQWPEGRHGSFFSFSFSNSTRLVEEDGFTSAGPYD